MTIEEYLKELNNSKMNLQEAGLVTNELIQKNEPANPLFIKDLIDHTIIYIDLIEKLIHEYVEIDTSVTYLQRKLKTINTISHTT
jgi:hypothetical protein